jgi:hypothetical protein
MPPINSLIDCAELIQALMPLDCYLTITDAEGTIRKFVAPKTFSLQVNAGDKVHSSGSIAETLRTGAALSKILPQEQYGVPVKAFSTLVVHNGNREGAIALGLSLETQQILQGSVESLVAVTGQITAASQELAINAMHLSEDLHGFRLDIEQMLLKIKETEDIINFVNEVANNSNLLGLNAAIEAARAGEQGRGFAVVAEEIRKMAMNSSKAVDDIRNLLAVINADAQKSVQGIKRLTSAGEGQAATTQEISASLEQLTAIAADVKGVAQKL